MEKKEEKAREYSKNITGVEFIGATEAEKAFEAGWDEALSNQWISVKEKQPEPNQMVLCRMISNEAIVSGYIYSEGCKWRVATSPDFHFEDYGDYECERKT